MSKAFRQIVKNVQGSTALVESKKGNIYPVIISDYVRIKKSLKVGDTALVRRINGRYYLVDVEEKPKRTETYTSEIPIKELGYDW